MHKLDKETQQEVLVTQYFRNKLNISEFALDIDEIRRPNDDTSTTIFYKELQQSAKNIKANDTKLHQPFKEVLEGLGQYKNDNKHRLEIIANIKKHMLQVRKEVLIKQSVKTGLEGFIKYLETKKIEVDKENKKSGGFLARGFFGCFGYYRKSQLSIAIEGIVQQLKSKHLAPVQAKTSTGSFRFFAPKSSPSAPRSSAPESKLKR